MINLNRTPPWTRQSPRGKRNSKWDSPIALYAYLANRSDLDPDSGCYVWTSPGAGPTGYVNVHLPMTNGKRGRIYIHRAAYRYFVGDIPDGFEIDHLQDRCTHRACWKPAHLEPVTHQENIRRVVAHRRATKTGASS